MKKYFSLIVVAMLAMTVKAEVKDANVVKNELRNSERTLASLTPVEKQNLFMLEAMKVDETVAQKESTPTTKKTVESDTLKDMQSGKYQANGITVFVFNGKKYDANGTEIK